MQEPKGTWKTFIYVIRRVRVKVGESAEKPQKIARSSYPRHAIFLKV